MFLSPLAVTVLILCLTWLILYYWKRNRNLPPGPVGLPFLGYYPFIKRPHYEHFEDLAKRYGNVFSFRTVGGDLIVVVSGLRAIKDFLLNKAEEIIGRPEQNNLLAWISDGLGITQEEGQPWKDHRRFFLHTAKNFGFGKQESEGLIHDETKTLIADVKKDGGKPSDFRHHIAYAVNSVVCQILFSKKFDKHTKLFEDISKGAVHLVEIFADERYMLVGPFYEHVVMKLLPSTKRMRKAKEIYKQVIKNMIDEHIKTFDPDHLRDYVDGYLHQAQKLDKSGETNHSFTKQRLMGICQNMMMEGTESVGGTIYGLLELASQYPDEQKKVQEELDAVIGTERLPSITDRPNLPYFEAFIQELYRLNMPFKISTHYCNFNETTIQGYRIPRRTITVANLWTINNDPDLYPEPAKFNPRRFVDENGKKIKSEGPYPFGIGKRSCIGESLAQMEVFLIIASVLQNFTVSPTDKSGYLKVVPRE